MAKFSCGLLWISLTSPKLYNIFYGDGLSPIDAYLCFSIPTLTTMFWIKVLIVYYSLLARLSIDSNFKVFRVYPKKALCNDRAYCIHAIFGNPPGK